MDLRSVVMNNLLGTKMQENSLQLLELYEELETGQNRASEMFQIKCLNGCGECCKRHEPEISRIEGEFAGMMIFFARRDLITLFDKIEDRTYCLFYDECNPYHCRIHSFRPLLCRTFHFCSMRGKDGKYKYKPCFVMKEFQQPLDADLVPAAEDFGHRLPGIDPDRAYELKLLSDSVLAGFRRAEYLDWLNNKRDPDKAA